MTEQDKSLILAMAEFMGIEFAGASIKSPTIPLFFDKSNRTIEYNPITNGTQLNEFVENAGIDVITAGNKWKSFCCAGTPEEVCVLDKSRTKSILLCAAEMLGVSYD